MRVAHERINLRTNKPTNERTNVLKMRNELAIYVVLAHRHRVLHAVLADLPQRPRSGRQRVLVRFLGEKNGTKTTTTTTTTSWLIACVRVARTHTRARARACAHTSSLNTDTQIVWRARFAHLPAPEHLSAAGPRSRRSTTAPCPPSTRQRTPVPSRTTSGKHPRTCPQHHHHHHHHHPS